VSDRFDELLDESEFEWLRSPRARAQSAASGIGEVVEDEREWLRASRRSAARRSWLLIGVLVSIALFLAWLTVDGLPRLGPAAAPTAPKAPPPPLPRPSWILFYGGLAIVGISVVAAVVRVSSLRLRRTPASLKADLEAAIEERDDLLRMSTLPFLRNRLSLSSHQMDLLNVEAPGLSEVFDPLYEVPVSATNRLDELIDSLPGGSIGIAGPRGAGKTTLIRSFCTGSRARADDVATLQSAPVEYSARDFVLHLFVSLCYEVLGQTEDNQFTAQSTHPAESLRRGFRSPPRLLLLGGVFLILGGLALFGLFVRDISVDPRLAWGLVMVWCGLLLVYVAMPSLFTGTPPVTDDGDEQRVLLRAAATRRLQELRFQQTISSSWTGGAKAPVGLQATVSRGSTLARIQLSFPELVTMLRQFMELVARKGKGRLIVGIDELDKLPSDDTARQFLNELKAIFGVRGCYYLISISEEAMANFDRRGLPFRDVFDSSFDDVVNVSYLSLPDAQRLLNRRVVLPIPFTCLCYCLSGGLARDLIRAARNVVEAQPKPSSDAQDLEQRPGSRPTTRHADQNNQDERTPLRIDGAARRLVGEEVRLKTAATVAALRAVELEPEITEVVQWCSRTQKCHPISHTALLDQCRWCIDGGSFRPGGSEDSEELLAARQTLFRLTRELCGFYYYTATILEFFDKGLDEQQVKDAIDSTAGDRSLDLLATSRQAFAVNPSLAWEAVSRFRGAWGFIDLSFPTRLLWARGAPTGTGSAASTQGTT
jgi:hypothetical protein